MTGDVACPSVGEDLSVRNLNNDGFERPVQFSDSPHLDSKPGLGRTRSSFSFMSCNSAVPERAFVVNLRRLMSAQISITFCF